MVGNGCRQVRRFGHWMSAGSSVWSLDVGRFVGLVAGLQAGRIRGQETVTVCKG